MYSDRFQAQWGSGGADDSSMGGSQHGSRHGGASIAEAAASVAMAQAQDLAAFSEAGDAAEESLGGVLGSSSIRFEGGAPPQDLGPTVAQSAILAVADSSASIPANGSGGPLSEGAAAGDTFWDVGPQEKKDDFRELLQEGCAFEGAALVTLTQEAAETGGDAGGTLNIVLEDGVMLTVELDSGERRLLELGYTQTLKRDLTLFELFATGFANFGLFVGIIPLYGAAFFNGGPAAVVWYWWIPGVLSTLMALSLAEIASSLPLAGSMYFWVAYLAPPRFRPVLAWITGWFEFVGGFVGAGGTALQGIGIIATIAQIAASDASLSAAPSGAMSPSPAPSAPPLAASLVWLSEPSFSPAVRFGLACAAIVLMGMLNCAKVKSMGQLLAIATVYQILLAAVMIVAVPVLAPTRQSASYVFGTYENNWEGITPNAAYAVVVALLLPQYAQYGVDAVAHISEEAKRADITTPLAMMGAQVALVVVAWGVLVAMTFSIQSVENMGAAGAANSSAFVQILCDIFYERFGSGLGVCVLLGLIYVGFFACTTSLVMTGARAAYALARDRGIPFSNMWSHVDSRKVPMPAVMLTCFLAIISLIPSLVSSAAYLATLSMGTICLFCAYLGPILLRLATPDADFKPGPFFIAHWLGFVGGKIVHILGLIYALYTICVFLIPTTFPITFATFNYAPIGIALAVSFFLGWWVLDASRWFQGPIVPAHAGETPHDAPVL